MKLLAASERGIAMRTIVSRTGARLASGYPASVVVGEFMKTFKDFPPRQKAASFTIDQAMESVGSGALH